MTPADLVRAVDQLRTLQFAERISGRPFVQERHIQAVAEGRYRMAGGRMPRRLYRYLNSKGVSR